ncbi:MAG: FkbM family methyltransferase [Armatimonadota bacterium]|nr:FkbM family methyltransferase [Armatimonadota bacterium]
MANMRADLMRALDHVAALLRRLRLQRLTRWGRDVLERRLQDGIVVRADGLRLYGGVRDRAFLYQAQTGVFEPETVGLLRRALWPGAIVVDVGAYLGYYTILASRIVGPQGKVLAFEPDPESVLWLLRNVSANHCGNVMVMAQALYDRVGKMRWHRNPTDPSKNSLAARVGAEAAMEIDCVTGDTGIPVPHVDVVKIDVEGTEPEVLRGMAQLLEQSPDPLLIVEFNPTALAEAGNSSETLQETLDRLGFSEVGRLDEQRDLEGRLELCNLVWRRRQRRG